MLTLRDTQIRALGRDLSSRFKREMLAILRRRLPTANEVELSSGIKDAMRTGSVYGLGSPETLRPYVLLTFLLGRQLDRDPRYPWAGEILRDTRRSPRGKVRALVECARLTHRDEIREWLDD